MNGKINIFFIISIILFFALVGICVFFGKNLYSDSDTIRQLEENTRELRKENNGFKLGFGIISRESRKRGEDNRELRKTVTEIEEDKRRYTNDLDSVNKELERTNKELDRLRREAEDRNREAIAASGELGEDIEQLGKIIESIEKNPIP